MTMNRFQFTMFFIFAFLLLSSVSFAANEATITVNKKDVTMYSGESVIVDVTVQNNQNSQDRFSISVFYLQNPGIAVIPERTSIDVGENSNSTFKLYFYASDCVEELRTLVTLNVKSLLHGDVQDSKNLNLNTVRNFSVCIYETGIDKFIISPLETLKTSVKLKNPTAALSPPIVLETSILKDTQVIEKFEDRIETVPANSMKQIDHNYTFSKYTPAGSYYVKFTLKYTSDVVLESKKIDFRVTELPSNVVKEENVKWGFFTQTMIIKVRNEGNTNSSGFYVTAEIPTFMRPFFFPKLKPTGEETIGNKIVFNWYIEGLAPAEERSIVYDVSTVNSLLIIIALIAFVMYSFKYIFRISIVKKHRYTGPITKDKEIVISLEVKNRTRHEINDVLIRDFVPSIVTVVEKFDTLRPTLRKVSGGTEIAWKLNSLGPLEDRVLTYRVRPTLDIVGILKLPKALIRYTDKEKKMKKVISKSIRIKAR